MQAGAVPLRRRVQLDGHADQAGRYGPTEKDEATVARWVRQALSPVLHSPFEGPRGAADHETLSGVLRYAEGLGWDSVRVKQDEEEAAERVMWNMVRAALPI
jgi:hypothetical protein